jgi:hypothetical protein
VSADDVNTLVVESDALKLRLLSLTLEEEHEHAQEKYKQSIVDSDDLATQQTVLEDMLRIVSQREAVKQKLAATTTAI